MARKMTMTAPLMCVRCFSFASVEKFQKRTPETGDPGPLNRDLEMATWWYSSLSLCGSLPTCTCFCGASSRSDETVRQTAYREWDCPQRRRPAGLRGGVAHVLCHCNITSSRWRRATFGLLCATYSDGRVAFSNVTHYATHPQPSSYVAPHILQCVGEVVGRHAETFGRESRSESFLIPFFV
jgi:hypothetical protein